MDTKNPAELKARGSEDDKKDKEERFLQNLRQISKLDTLITQFTDHINQGLTDLAFLRFKNETLGYSLTGGSYSQTPAKRVLRESKGKMVKIETNIDNEWILEETEEDFYEENTGKEEETEEETSGFLKNLKEKEAEMKNIDLNEQILTKMGIVNRDPLVYHSQREFIQALEKLIELKNFYECIGVYK